MSALGMSMSCGMGLMVLDFVADGLVLLDCGLLLLVTFY